MSLPVDPGPPTATEPRPARRRRAWVAPLVAVLAVAVLGAAGLAWLVVTGRDGVDRIGVADARARYPDTWDPRVLDLVSFVEKERGLTFKHPVKIAFLDDAAFRKKVTEAEAPDEKEKAEIKSAEAMLRAVGLLSGDVDLLAAATELAGDGVIGVYVPEDERIFVRGETLDDERRSTLVHEMTHALQDQHFDIGGHEEKEKTSGQSAAYSALVEADASAVEDAWQESLPAAAREALSAAEEKTGEGADFKGVPEVFIELLAFPYSFGPDFLQAVLDKEGMVGRNRLFAEPPTSEEHILLPETYRSRQQPQQVAVPALGNGEKAVEDSEDDIGMLSLLVMLSERIDFGVAWPAVQGWAGDSFVAFERAGTTCVRGDVVFDEAAQAERFAAAFASWSRGRPATSTRNERSVVFESCDPGAAAAGGRPAGRVSGIQGLELRKEVITALGEQGVPAKTAECIVDGLLAKLGADRVAKVGNTTNPRDPALRELQRTVAGLAPGCT